MKKGPRSYQQLSRLATSYKGSLTSDKIAKDSADAAVEVEVLAPPRRPPQTMARPRSKDTDPATREKPESIEDPPINYESSHPQKVFKEILRNSSYHKTNSPRRVSDTFYPHAAINIPGYCSHKELGSPGGPATTSTMDDTNSCLITSTCEDHVSIDEAEVVADNSAGFNSPSFLIPKKKKGEVRLISDSRALNKFVLHRHIKIPSLATISPNLTRGCWLSTFDVRDGYFDVPIAAQDRPFFRFKVGLTTYQM